MSSESAVANRCLFYLGLLSLLLYGCYAPLRTAEPPNPALLPSPEIASSSTSNSSATPSSPPTETPTAPPTPTAMPTATPTPNHATTRTTTPSLTASPKPRPTPTVDPYAGLTIADLSARDYGQGDLVIGRVLAVSPAFTRTLISYPSDSLTLSGFMNVPVGAGPFPVVVVLHGYIDPAKYQTVAYTARYADALARAGYLVLHPSLRGYPLSDDGPNRFRVGMAVDTLNLVALVERMGGREEPLAQADARAIGLMGHSMGGGITIRALTVNASLRAAVLYASMNADERINHERILIWTNGQRGREELETPEEDLRRISPVYYLDRITAAVSIHHSTDDKTVPWEWSDALAKRLEALGKLVEFFTYSETPHTFRGESDRLFIERMIAFFDRHLKGG